MNTEITTVKKNLIRDDKRLFHTARLFGNHFSLQLEPVIYGITRRMAKDYSGGYWNFYSLDNGGFYMAPDVSEPLPIRCDNCWEGSLSGDALGVVSCLYTYSHLSFSQDEYFARLCAEHYHRLRHYMFEHPEVAEVLGAID